MFSLVRRKFRVPFFGGNMCNCLVAIFCIVPGEDVRTHVAWWGSFRYSRAIVASDPQRFCFNTIL